MSGSRFLLCILVIAAGTFPPACTKKQTPKALQLNLPKPVARVAPTLLPQPDFDFAPVQHSGMIDSLEVVLPPAPPLKPEPKRVRRAAPAVAAAKLEDLVEEEGATELPQLGEVLSEQQQRDYMHAIEASLEQAKRIAVLVQRRPLDPRQADVLGQVQGFIRQAEAAQQKDIPLARNLALRAEILAKDLFNSLR